MLLLSIFLQLLLLLLNAFFASSEMALVSVNETKIKSLADNGDKKAAIVYKLIKRPNRYLSTIQIGITLSNLLVGAISASRYSAELSSVIYNGGLNFIPLDTLRAIITLIVTLLLSIITIIFGELVPKRLALKSPEKRALKSAGAIDKLAKVAHPLVWFLTKCTNGVGRLFGITDAGGSGTITEEELKLMINASEETGVIEEYEKEMINNVFEFNDTPVDELMTHRSKVVAIPDNVSFEELIKLVRSESFSRYPVYSQTLDDIIGVIHIKDLLTCEKELPDLKSVMRKPYFVPEGKPAAALLREMKNNKNHLAIVVDEYGLTAGIITMEDLIEEIVGRIYDEHDKVDFIMQQTGENTYLVSGMLQIDEVNELLSLHLPTDDYDTIAGFLIGILDYIPQDDEKPTAIYENLQISAEQVKNKAVTLVKIVIGPKDQPTQENTATSVQQN